MLMRLLAITASAALLAGAAQAQDSATAGAAVTPPAGAQPVAPATAAPVDTTGYNSQASGAATVPASSSALGDAATLKAGDPGVVSNPPVADTPENRAKYGKPDSSAGKHTQPAGN